MNERERREKARYSATITWCAGCAEKLKEKNLLEELPGEDRMGQCPICFGIYRLSTYRITPKRKPIRRAQTGGGERARAGGGK